MGWKSKGFTQALIISAITLAASGPQKIWAESSDLEMKSDLKKEFHFYGAFNLAFFGDAGRYSLVDNGTRLGVKYLNTKAITNWNLGARAEYGVRTTAHDSEFEIKNGNIEAVDGTAPFTNRLGFIYFENPEHKFKISLGKQWSPFYEVTSVTDIFYMFGAEASGAFSLNSDGGYLGTGRADNSILLTKEIHSFKLQALYLATGKQSIEIKDANGNEISGKPKRVYERSYGGAIQYESETFKIGVSHMTGDFEYDGSPQHSRASTLGLSFKLDKLELGQVVTFSKGHQIDDNGQLFDARGLETTISYQYTSRLNLRAGLNKVSSKDSDYDAKAEHDYGVEKYILGIVYQSDSYSFSLEGVSDHSKNADNSEVDNSLVGVNFEVEL